MHFTMNHIHISKITYLSADSEITSLLHRTDAIIHKHFMKLKCVLVKAEVSTRLDYGRVLPAGSLRFSLH